MAIIIAICSGCGKEVPMEIDTTEEKFIGNMMKDGTTCEACILLKPNNKCYCGPSIIGLYDEEQVKVNLAVDKMLIDMSRCKPGAKLRVRRAIEYGTPPMLYNDEGLCHTWIDRDGKVHTIR